MTKTMVLAAALVLAAQATAQTTASPAKKELVAKILDAQKPGIEQLARQLVEQPAAQLLNRVGQYIQAKVPADKREAAARDAQADARKYIEDTLPGVRERAMKLAPTTIGPIIEEKMSEDELRQVLAVFESEAWRKFQGLAPDMQRALGAKLVEEAKPFVEPKLRALDATLAKRLGIKPPAAAASGGK